MDPEANPKIDSYLDGELRKEVFNSEELEQINFHQEIIGETQKLHRSLTTPDLSAGVMARITTMRPASKPKRIAFGFLVDWIWTPRRIQLRPATVIVFTGMIALLGFLWGGKDRLLFQKQDPAVAAATGLTKIFVQFRFEAPEASVVRLGGSFTEWQPTYTLHEISPGVWSVVVPLDPGVHDYSFFVNGRWITDPAAPVVDDGFGGTNSRLLVVVPSGTSRI